MRTFFLLWRQSGFRTARPEGAQSHASCRCGVAVSHDGTGEAVDGVWVLLLLLGPRPATHYTVWLWLNGGGSLRRRVIRLARRPCAPARCFARAAAWRHRHGNGNRARPEYWAASVGLLVGLTCLLDNPEQIKGKVRDKCLIWVTVVRRKGKRNRIFIHESKGRECVEVASQRKWPFTQQPVSSDVTYFG